MITKFSKWILFVSSYIPLYIIFIVSNVFDIYNEHSKVVILKNYSVGMLMDSIEVNIFLIITFTALIVISSILLCIIFWSASKSSNFKNITDIEINNKIVNDYILVYILPFISVQSNDVKQLTIFLLVFITIGIISVKNDLVYINPVLYLLKYNIYIIKIDANRSSSMLITKYTVLEFKEKGICKNDAINIRISRISSNIYYL